MNLFNRILGNFKKQEKIPEIAIAHDYLTQRGGAERVVLALHHAFPEATIYTTLYDPEKTYPDFKNCKVITSPLNRISLFRKDHRLALPFLPLFSSFLRPKADIVIASSTGWAHGFNLPKKTLVYCHSPARWIYLTDQYLGDAANPLVSIALRILRPFLLFWDQRAAAKQPNYVANSTTIKDRIHNVYGKTVDIIYPPFSVKEDGEHAKIKGLEEFMDQGYYLIVSRLLPYKNIQHAVKAFSGSNKQLLVIGAGPMKEDLKAISDSNIAFASHISDAQMRYAYANSTALLAISHEDFGITPLEGGSFGKPTIALKAGGFLDTIVEGLNGTFIEAPTAELIRQAVDRFTPEDFDPFAIKEYVQKFSEERFIAEIKGKIEAL
ncbi:glycosyltransferase [Rothia sp. SD9660Na]|uniref:glycosyltransferase n=1 Tax=Rothia sp. SD9660Na TaxID=3047030 RepID=UPI0024B95400|nr:glycosyltransferase [Rothia sp. SD9660Na]WHS50013.1 glycosyltransferase [Rothia sp. SD9660Na]